MMEEDKSQMKSRDGNINSRYAESIFINITLFLAQI